MTIFPAKPASRQIDPVIFSNVRSIRLDNGIPVFLIEAGTEDVIRVEFTFNAGYINETVPLTASATNMMLGEGSKSLRSAELNRLLDFYGSFHNLYCERDKAGLVFFFMTKHNVKLLELTSMMLLEPAFREHELRALMRKRKRWYLVNREKVQNMASDKFYEAVFGKDHPYGRITTEKDFDRITSSSIKDFHTAFYDLSNLAIIASGRINGGITETLNNIFGKQALSATRKETTHQPLSASGERKIHLGKENAVQTAVRIGSATINKRHPDYIGLKITDTILGGYFGSRLMKNIREDKGLTYGIYSSVTSLGLSGYKLISAEVSKKFTQKAIDEIFNEIRAMREKPVNREELEVVQNYMLGEMLRMFDGPFALAESFRSVWEFGLDHTYYEKMARKIKSIEPEEIMHIARTYYNIEELYQVTAG